MSNPNKEPKRLKEKERVESSKKALLEDLGMDIDGPEFEDGPEFIGWAERSGVCPVCFDLKCDNPDSIG